MVYPARQYHQPRTGLVVNMLALVGLTLTSAATSADALENLFFEPQALSDATLAFASTAAPPATAKQAAPLRPLAERATAIAAYVRDIRTLQEERGPFDASLSEQYLALGRLYQEVPDYDKALETYAKAEHISRINFGLDAPEQFLPVELSIDCYLAKGEFDAALERREYLVYLHREHYGFDAAETVPQLRALGDMYFEAFERGIHPNVETPVPALSYGAETGFADPGKLSPIESAFLWLDQARAQYSTSIRNLVMREDYTNPLLVDLETNLIETLFLQAFRRNVEGDPVYFVNFRDVNVRDMLTFDRKNEQIPLYRSGEQAFSRILSYLRADPAADPLQVAQAMLELGDWHMLFDRQKRGLAQYEEARAYLMASGVSAADIATLLAPPVPVQLPTFRDAPHTRTRLAPGTDAAFAGYIDVALTLGATGEVRDVEVLNKSANANAAIEARLQKILRNAPFRPRLAGTERADKVTLRYNFAQL